MNIFKKIFSTRYGLMKQIDELEVEQERLHGILNSIIQAPSLFVANNPHKKESQGIMIGLTAASKAAMKAGNKDGKNKE